MYRALIIELTGCTAEEAPMVEQLMRDVFHTLDSLPRARFKREAKSALKDLRADPELRRLLAPRPVVGTIP